MLVQVKICENHQNGKDTHLRGLQIFARDTAVRRGAVEEEKIIVAPDLGEETGKGEEGRKKAARRKMEEKTWEIPEFARVGEIR
jgi:anaphase-promoting complex subunit 10